MNTRKKYNDKDWEKLASLLSGETEYPSDELAGFREDDHFGIEKSWKEMEKIGNNKQIDVDKAWNSIYSRIERNGFSPAKPTIIRKFRTQTVIAIAASFFLIVGLGISMVYLKNTGVLTGKISVSANADERNKEVLLPDGSKVFLNRNSIISFNKYPGKTTRNVILKGEAFFDIKRDPSRPFVIDAGKAEIKVLGTSFSVLTSNANNAVEVYVKTGSVLLTNSSGNQIVLEPGYIGTMDSKSSARNLNDDPNYLAWNTDLLDYKNTPLEKVFADLKKVYNIDVIADNPEILKFPLRATYEKEPQDTIMKVLCTTFDLELKKDGAVYHLKKK
jgi:transmembrane sensor